MSPRAHALLKEYYAAAVEANVATYKNQDSRGEFKRLKAAFSALETYIEYCESGGS